MKKNRMIKMMGAAAAAALVAFALTACSGSSADDGSDGLKTDTGLTGGVAATVNGTDIEENKVTRAINNFRISNQLDEESAWKEFLQNGENTPESFRYDVVGQLVDQELIKQCAGQLGISVDDAKIDTYVEKMSSQYSSEEAWLDAVDRAGWDDINAYRDALRNSIYSKELTEHFEAEEDGKLTDDELLTAVQSGIASYDGAKRTSVIQFNGDDTDTANDVLARIRNGELTFTDAVEQYSTDDESKAKGGDMGWDKLAEDLPAAYSTAITALDNGGISEVTAVGDNLDIIQVTDVWTAPENVAATSQVPEEFVTAIRSTTVTSKANDDVDNWVDERHSDNDIQVNPMPENAPYKVDMSDVYSEEQITKINDNALQEVITGVEVTEDVTADAEAVAAEGDAAQGDAAATEGAASNAGTAQGEGDAAAAEGDAADVTTAESEVAEDQAVAQDTAQREASN